MPREVFQNDSATTLNGGINNSVTSVVVNDGSVFPASGQFRLLVGTELMLCTSRSGNTLTVTRGAEGTTAASHSNGDDITLVHTEGGLQRFGRDNDAYYDSGRPRLGAILDASGNIITSSSFTWVNQGTATIADQNDTIHLSVPISGTGDNIRLQQITAPSTPYTITAAFQATIIAPAQFPAFGLAFRESSSGEITTFQITQRSNTGPEISAHNWNSATGFNSDVLGRRTIFTPKQPTWLRVTDDGTDLIYEYSCNGIDWLEFTTQGRTAFMAGGPDQVGWFMNQGGQNVFEAHVDLLLES